MLLNFGCMPVLSVIRLSTFFFFKIFFFYVGLFKSLLNFLKHCFCFSRRHVESLLPVQGLNSHPLEGEVLTTGPTGKYLKLSTFKETRSSKLYYLFFMSPEKLKGILDIL